MDSNHRSRRERDGRGGGGSRPTIVVSRDDLCLMTPVQLIGPAGNSRETLFAKSGTDRFYGAGGETSYLGVKRKSGGTVTR